MESERSDQVKFRENIISDCKFYTVYFVTKLFELFSYLCLRYCGDPMHFRPALASTPTLLQIFSHSATL